jgi:hypothetical protein
MKASEQTRNVSKEHCRNRTSSNPIGVSEFSPKHRHGDVISRASSSRSHYQYSTCKHGIEYTSTNEYESTRITYSQPNHSTTMNTAMNSFKGEPMLNKLKQLEQVGSCSDCFDKMLNKMFLDRDSVISKLNTKRDESLKRIKEVTNKLRSAKSLHNPSFKFNSRNCLINTMGKAEKATSKKPAKRYIKNKHISLIKTEVSTGNNSTIQIS